MFQSNAIAFTIVPNSFKKFVVQQTRWGRSSFRGLLFAARFFVKKNLKQKIVFYISMFITLLTPLVLFVSTVGFFILGRYDSAFFYFLSLFFVSTLVALTNKLLVEYFTVKDFFYRIFLL